MQAVSIKYGTNFKDYKNFFEYLTKTILDAFGYLS